MRKIKVKRKLLLGSIVLGGLVLLFLAGTFLQIYQGVKRACSQAKAEYHAECVDSLIQTLKSDNKTFRERNGAIWALGQLADTKALPVLKSLYTGNKSAKEPLDITISQYELKKAIKWCTKGNLTSWMYRDL